MPPSTTARFAAAEHACGGYAPPPHLAVCVHGPDASPASLASLRFFVLDALGNRNAVVFSRLHGLDSMLSMAASVLGFDERVLPASQSGLPASRVQCWSDVERYEATQPNASTFDEVLFVAAAKLWIRPLWPYCLHSTSGIRVSGAHAHVRWSPRALAPLLLNQSAISSVPHDESLGAAVQLNRRAGQRAGQTAESTTAVNCSEWRRAATVPYMPQGRVRPLQPPCPTEIDRDRSDPIGAACAADGGVSTAPRLALCLGGLARTLLNALVPHSIRGHVIDALGMRTTVFAHIRLEDQRVREDAYTPCERSLCTPALELLRQRGVPTPCNDLMHSG